MDIWIGMRKYTRNQKIRIKNITSKGDLDLNGRIGRLTERFPEINFGVVGCYINGTDGTKIKVNLAKNEFELVGAEE